MFEPVKERLVRRTYQMRDFNRTEAYLPKKSDEILDIFRIKGKTLQYAYY
jgi:hypothetical protein